MRNIPPHTYQSAVSSVFTITLTQEQADRINLCPIISIKFCVNNRGEQSPRYLGVYTNYLAENKKVIDGVTYYTGINFRRCYNQYGWHFQSQSGSNPAGGLEQCINTGKDYISTLWFVLNRITGEGWIYDELGNQLGYRKHESMKYDKFVPSDNIIKLVNAASSQMYEVAIYEGNILGWSNKYMKLQDGVPCLKKNKWDYINTNLIWRDIYNEWVDGEDGYKHLTFAANQWRKTLDCFDWGNITPKWCWKKFEVLSGSIRVQDDNYGYDACKKNYYDAEGNDVTGQTLGAGVYEVYFTGYGNTAIAFGTIEAGELRILESKTGYACENFRINNFNVTHGMLWDDAAGRLVKGGTIDTNNYINLDAPIITSNSPGYIGQKRISGSNFYIGAGDYTWKQINNV